MTDLSGWTNSVKPDRPYHDCQEMEGELERLRDALEKQYDVTKQALQASGKLAGPYCHPKDTRRTVQ